MCQPDALRVWAPPVAIAKERQPPRQPLRAANGVAYHHSVGDGTRPLPQPVPRPKDRPEAGATSDIRRRAPGSAGERARLQPIRGSTARAVGWNAEAMDSASSTSTANFVAFIAMKSGKVIQSKNGMISYQQIDISYQKNLHFIP